MRGWRRGAARIGGGLWWGLLELGGDRETGVGWLFLSVVKEVHGRCIHDSEVP